MSAGLSRPGSAEDRPSDRSRGAQGVSTVKHVGLTYLGKHMETFTKIDPATSASQTKCPDLPPWNPNPPPHKATAQTPPRCCLSSGERAVSTSSSHLHSLTRSSPPPSRACLACPVTCLLTPPAPTPKIPGSGIMEHNAQVSTLQLTKPLHGLLTPFHAVSEQEESPMSQNPHTAPPP